MDKESTIELAIAFLDVPPSLRDRARSNLRQLSIEEIGTRVDIALQRKQRAKRWVKKQRGKMK